MQRKSAFRFNEWHHGYLGFAMIIFGAVFQIWWVLIVGSIIFLDEVSQIWLGQHGGILHLVYIKTLYKIKIIRELNEFLDRVFK